MNLEKLGVILFFKYFQQLEEVKSHLFASVSELLMATLGSVSISHQITKESSLLKNLNSIDEIHEKIDTILQFAIKQLESKKSHPEIPNFQHIKESIIESILSVLNSEMENMPPETPNHHLKIDALNTVKTVLLSQLHQNYDASHEQEFDLKSMNH